MTRSIRFAAGSLIAVVAALMAGSSALACIPIATLNLSQTQANPGTVIQATMHQASSKAGVVDLHFGSVTGPVLASSIPDADGGLITSFTIPETAAGDYVVVATQKLTPGVSTWGMPARAVIHVTTPGGPPVGASGFPPVQTQVRPVGLVADSGPDLTALALIALATAAVGLMLAGGAAFLLGRGNQPQTARSE